MRFQINKQQTKEFNFDNQILRGSHKVTEEYKYFCQDMGLDPETASQNYVQVIPSSCQISFQELSFYLEVYEEMISNQFSFPTLFLGVVYSLLKIASFLEDEKFLSCLVSRMRQKFYLSEIENQMRKVQGKSDIDRETRENFYSFFDEHEVHLIPLDLRRSNFFVTKWFIRWRHVDYYQSLSEKKDRIYDQIIDQYVEQGGNYFALPEIVRSHPDLNIPWKRHMKTHQLKMEDLKSVIYLYLSESDREVGRIFDQKDFSPDTKIKVKYLEPFILPVDPEDEDEESQIERKQIIFDQVLELQFQIAFPEENGFFFSMEVTWNGTYLHSHNNRTIRFQLTRGDFSFRKIIVESDFSHLAVIQNGGQNKSFGQYRENSLVFTFTSDEELPETFLKERARHSYTLKRRHQTLVSKTDTDIGYLDTDEEVSKRRIHRLNQIPEFIESSNYQVFLPNDIQPKTYGNNKENVTFYWADKRSSRLGYHPGRGTFPKRISFNKKKVNLDSLTIEVDGFYKENDKNQDSIETIFLYPNHQLKGVKTRRFQSELNEKGFLVSKTYFFSKGPALTLTLSPSLKIQLGDQELLPLSKDGYWFFIFSNEEYEMEFEFHPDFSFRSEKIFYRKDGFTRHLQWFPSGKLRSLFSYEGKIQVYEEIYDEKGDLIKLNNPFPFVYNPLASYCERSPLFPLSSYYPNGFLKPF